MIHEDHEKKQLALLHIVFTAGSWPMVHHNATLIALSLGLLFPLLGAKITTPIIIYSSYYFGGSLCMRRRNTVIFILLLSFFFPSCWGTGEIWPCCARWKLVSSLPGAIISQSVSKFESYPKGRYTSTYPHSCRQWQWVTYRKNILWRDCSKVYRWKRQAIFPQAIIHPSTSSDSIKGLDDNLALQ